MKINATYEDLLQDAEDDGLLVDECVIPQEGYISGNVISINRNMPTTYKKCALAEELGHARISTGDILDLTKIANLRQENKARCWAYEKLIPADVICWAAQDGHTEIWDMAEYLEVSEDFLREAIEYYRRKELL